MKLTRDSMLWPITALAAVAVFLGSHFDLLTKSLGLGPEWQAGIELIAGLAALVASLLRASPLALSPTNDMASLDHDTTLTITGKPKE